jgi:glycosyltransferase involved in cell wall biosynthesis
MRAEQPGTIVPNRSLLIVGSHLSASVGTRALGEELAARLAGRGWSVFTTSTRRARLPRLADMLAACWRLRNRYAIAQVDVFSGAAFFWAEAVCALLRRLGKPHVLVLRGGNLPAFARRAPRRVRRLLHGAAAVVAPSAYLAEQLAAYHPASRLIPNAIELADYPYVHRAQARPKLVWLRAFHEIYNPPLAPEVLALLVPEFPGIEMLMAGPDKRDGSLARTIEAARGLNVEIRGGVPKSEIASWINRGDIYLNTTNFDNMPVTLVEAMACGACIVTTNAGGIPYLARNEHDALIVPPADARAMAGAVRRILLEPALAARLSAGARATAEQFDWPPVLDQFEALYEYAGLRSAHGSAPQPHLEPVP